MNEQRHILITGCSSGIGEYCAQALHKEGWKVFATARKSSDIQRLNDQGLTSLYLDYTDEASIQACVDDVLAMSNGRLDAIFNNGAYGIRGAVEYMPTQALRDIFEANFFGWHELTRLVIPFMRAQGYGRIINNSSVLGLVAIKYRGAYSATKFALEGLTDTMRLELRGSGIHVSTIEPGPIRSRFSENALYFRKSSTDMVNSVHGLTYEELLTQISAPPKVSRFELGPESVYKKLHHALNTKRPSPHYYVTFPTYYAAFLRRVLGGRLLDAIASRF